MSNRKEAILGKYWTYEEYLSSPEWRNTKKFFQPKKKKCFICKTTKKLNLHHKTYKRVGNEWNTDLVWLCEYHHLETHKLAKDRKWRLYDAHIKLRRIVRRERKKERKESETSYTPMQWGKRRNMKFQKEHVRDNRILDSSDPDLSWIV